MSNCPRAPPVLAAPPRMPHVRDRPQVRNPPRDPAIVLCQTCHPARAFSASLGAPCARQPPVSLQKPGPGGKRAPSRLPRAPRQRPARGKTGLPRASAGPHQPAKSTTTTFVAKARPLRHPDSPAPARELFPSGSPREPPRAELLDALGSRAHHGILRPTPLGPSLPPLSCLSCLGTRPVVRGPRRLQPLHDPLDELL